jgi:signal transduction histidine kinase
MVALFWPGVPVAGHSPLLSITIAALSGAGGLLLLTFGLLRFQARGGPLDLLTAVAFGALAVANLTTGVVGPIVEDPPSQPEVALFFVIVQRALAGGLFLVGSALAGMSVAPAHRARVAAGATASVAAVSMVGGLALWAVNGMLPSVVDGGTLSLLGSGAPIRGVLPGQAGWLLALDGAVAVLWSVAAAGYVRLARRLRDAYTTCLAVVLSLLAFCQMYALVFPPLASDYVSRADVLRLLAYVVLLFSLVARIGREIAEREGREERMRLSRELHDGLAQQLSLLHLRIDRAAEPKRAPERRQHDLEAARRLVEAALLEARQAITALRSGTVSWADFDRTVRALADEFAVNHEVDIDVAVEGTATVDTELQVEVLRILHEAWSNAVRHGAARRVAVTLAAQRGGIEIVVTDDGRGFDAAQTLSSTGVGVRSMIERLQRRGGRLHFASTPGQGAEMRAWMPVASGRKRFA